MNHYGKRPDRSSSRSVWSVVWGLLWEMLAQLRPADAARMVVEVAQRVDGAEGTEVGPTLQLIAQHTDRIRRLGRP